jgi:hypothetical protein
MSSRKVLDDYLDDGWVPDPEEKEEKPWTNGNPVYRKGNEYIVYNEATDEVIIKYSYPMTKCDRE